MKRARIIGTGSYLPERVVSNEELSLSMETSDEWIVSRTGIESRHVAADEEMTSDLAVEAARAALAAAQCDVQEVDLIIVATTTPDMVFPSTACLLQSKLGIKHAAAFDVQAVCTGFIYALSTANALLQNGQHQCALVIGAEVFSRLLDWNDRRTCVLFGDGAGAVVLRPDTDRGVMAAQLQADGSQGHILRVAAGISGGEIQGHPYLEMDGQAVFKLAVKALSESARQVLQQAGLSADDIDWYIPHQANLRILKALCERIGVAPERLIKTVAKHGNTSAASVPLALDCAVNEGKIQDGQHLLLQGVGGGMTWGSVLLRW